MNEENLKKIRGLLLLTSVTFAVLSSLIFSIGIFYNFDTSVVFKYTLIFTYLYIILSSKILFPWNHSIMLFFMAFGLFLLGRMFLDVFFGSADIYIADKLTYYHIENSTVNIVLYTFIISLLCVHIGALAYKSYNKTDLQDESPSLSLNSKAKILVLLLVAILLPGTLMKLIHDYKEIVASGYLSAFSSDRVQAPLPYRLSWYLLKSIAPILIVFIKKRHQLICFVLLMLLIDISNVLSGNRSTLIAPFAFLFWFYYKFIGKKTVKALRLLIIGVTVIIFSVISINLREKADVMQFNLTDYSKAFFYSQGVSYLLNVYYYDYADELKNPSHFAAFNTIHNYFIRGQVEIGHSPQYVEKSVSLDHKITYAVSPNSYLAGQGLGSSYLIELYALGGFIVLAIGSILLGVIIIKFENYFLVNVELRYLSWFWIYHLLSMPRGGLLPDFMPILVCVTFLFILKIITTDKYKKSLNV